MACTHEQYVRLSRLLRFIDTTPRTRESILKKLSYTRRTFFRDLSLLRSLGIKANWIAEGQYLLEQPLSQALDALPLPDIGLTIAEAKTLASGNTAAHQNLRKQLRLHGISQLQDSSTICPCSTTPPKPDSTN